MGCGCWRAARSGSRSLSRPTLLPAFGSSSSRPSCGCKPWRSRPLVVGSDPPPSTKGRRRHQEGRDAHVSCAGSPMGCVATWPTRTWPWSWWAVGHAVLLDRGRRARATRWIWSARPPRWSVTAAGPARGRADPIRRRDRPGGGPDQAAEQLPGGPRCSQSPTSILTRRCSAAPGRWPSGRCCKKPGQVGERPAPWGAACRYRDTAALTAIQSQVAR